MNTSKHEWLNGIVYMMVGGTFEHVRIVDGCSMTPTTMTNRSAFLPWAALLGLVGIRRQRSGETTTH